MSPSRLLLCVAAPLPAKSGCVVHRAFEDRHAIDRDRPAGDRRTGRARCRSTCWPWCVALFSRSVLSASRMVSVSPTLRARDVLPQRRRRCPARRSAPGVALRRLPLRRASVGVEVAAAVFLGPWRSRRAATATVQRAQNDLRWQCVHHSWLLTYSSIWSAVEIAFEFIS